MAKQAPADTPRRSSATTSGGIRRARRQHITATVDPDLIDWLDGLAENGGISRSQAINSIMRRVKNAEERAGFQVFPELVPVST